ncbi:MAG TPA: hypothetical protein VGA90_09000, partial [Methylomirabilota bacterium]
MSRAHLFRSIKALDLEAAAAVLAAQPELLQATDDRRRNPLHFLCSLPAAPKTRERSIRLARHLLGAGIDIDAPAFVEGALVAVVGVVDDLDAVAHRHAHRVAAAAVGADPQAPGARHL